MHKYVNQNLHPKEQAQGLFWNDKIQSLVIKRLLDRLSQTAENFYKEDQSLNALVVIDEAHRLAPRDLPREDDAARGVRSVLIDAARTTRKYGLGWLFISQTLSSLHPEILQQLRIFFFGFGLGLGQEFQSLRQLVGSSGTALDLYQLFRDPHSAFDTKSRQYSFCNARALLRHGIPSVIYGELYIHVRRRFSHRLIQSLPRILIAVDKKQSAWLHFLNQFPQFILVCMGRKRIPFHRAFNANGRFAIR